MQGERGQMLKRVILKNFKFNLKNYLLFFLSNTLAVSLTLVFWGLKINLGEHITDEAVNYVMSIDFYMAVVMMSVVAAALTIYAVRNYIRIRVRDYSMLKLMGIRKKTFQIIVFAEYGLGWLLSVVAGFACGSLIYYVFQEILYYLEPDMIEKTIMGSKVYLLTFGVSLAIVLMIVLIMLVLMEGKSLDSLAAGKEIQETKIRKGWWLTVPVIGVALLIYGTYLFSENGESGMFWAQVLWLVSAVLILYVGISIFLEFLKNRKKFYLHNLFRINQLNHHFTSNFFVILMLFVIHFFASGYVNSGMAQSFPIFVDRGFYPYDYIIPVREDDETVIRNITEENAGIIETIPMFKVTTANGLDQFGVSQSTFRNLTGKDYDLTDNEFIFYKEDNAKTDRKITDEATIETNSYMRMGKYRGESFNFYSYELDGYEHVDIKAVSGNLIGCLADGYRDSWVVMSDERFDQYWEQLKEDSEEPAILALINVPKENRGQAGREFREYSEKYGVEEKGNLQANYYDVNHIIGGIEKRNLFQISSKLLLVLSLLFSSVFIVKIKAMTDESSMQRRYTFLSSMGMHAKERRKTARFEIFCTAAIPLIFGIIYGIDYQIQYWKTMNDSGDDISGSYVKLCVILTLIYLLVQFFCVQFIAAGTAKKVTGGSEKKS